MSRSVRSVRGLFAVLALALLASACANSAAENGVNVKTVATDLTYGIPKPVAPASPANQAPVPPNPLPIIKLGGPLPKNFPPLGPVPALCPTASPNTYPPPAPTSIEGKPLPGTYLWKIKGKQTVTGIGKIGLPPYSKRIVSDVKNTPQGFSFVVEERELVFGSGYTIKTTYESRNSGQVSGQEPAGLYLTKIERIHRTDKNANSTFSPNPAILMLPTPTTLGAKVNSVGIDPVSLEVLRQQGTVVARKRIDACGKTVDTFYVHATQQFAASNGNTTQRLFEYGVATGIGGLPGVEHVESPCADSAGHCPKDAVTFEMDATLGQLTPSKI